MRTLRILLATAAVSAISVAAVAPAGAVVHSDPRIGYHGVVPHGVTTNPRIGYH